MGEPSAAFGLLLLAASFYLWQRRSVFAAVGSASEPESSEALATLNRTLKGLLLGKIAAEYVLRWVPAGTHDWRQFLKPDELRAMLDGEPLTVTGPYGLAYDPLNDRWSEGDDVGVNYMMMATRDA